MFTMKQARTGVGLSQSEMADKLRINVNTYRKYEADPDKMTIGIAKKFCKIVDLDINSISVGF